ncbi:hypothetical protein PR048_004878 [Dryococelus australis]|uniref:DNA helicase Pif1-like 2B domain-containing protein n=1 Tax=Dryococelus australis TaxID=614101 RepID=A0ABQ9I8Q3_9NEOP|nr:hypothetical protein PR048_004878 [Dryococelus australis]
MEQRRNERAGKSVDPLENLPTNGIVRYDSHMQKSAAKNNDVSVINFSIQNEIPGEAKTYKFIDTVMNQDEVVIYPNKFLNSLDFPDMPPHVLTLKIGVPIILLRNINPPRLCNGTRLSVRKMMNNIIEATILKGKFKGENVLLPRITMIPTDMPFESKRLQFPVRLAFAMTINKAQGQSLQMCGLNLENPCFSHGQLYVACSRSVLQFFGHIVRRNNGKLEKTILEGKLESRRPRRTSPIRWLDQVSKITSLPFLRTIRPADNSTLESAATEGSVLRPIGRACALVGTDSLVQLGEIRADVHINLETGVSTAKGLPGHGARLLNVMRPIYRQPSGGMVAAAAAHSTDTAAGADSAARAVIGNPPRPPLFLERCARGCMFPFWESLECQQWRDLLRRRKNVLVRLTGASAIRDASRELEKILGGGLRLYILPQPSGRQSLTEAVRRVCASEVKRGQRLEIARRRRVRCSWLEWTRRCETDE